METIRSSTSNNRAVFLDRDGVLIEEMFPMTRAEQIRVAEGAPQALQKLAASGWKLIVVTNQTVVARGLLTEAELVSLERTVEERLSASGAPPLDGFYYCPHHPRATLPSYRGDCECRKPRPGMLLRASHEVDVDLSRSVLVGDRISDIAAGSAAGCKTVLVETGAHREPPIESSTAIDPNLRPDHVCADLAAAARWILGEAP